MTAEREAVAYTPDGREVCIGLNDGIPAHMYHRLPGFTQSMAKIIRDQSPAHLKWRMDHPVPPSPAQLLGAAIHDCVLLPDLFHVNWVRGIEGDGRTKAVKEARDALQAEYPNATVLKPEDYDVCIDVRAAIARHPKARQLLTGDAEQTMLWHDPKTGVLCRGRADLLAHRSGAVVDLKSCQSAAPQDFSRAIWSFSYMIQAAFYLDGAAALGLPFDRFALAAIEKTPPYGIALYELSLAAIDDGRKLYRPLLETYARCLETDTWPSYSEDVTVIDIPRWATSQVAEEVMESAA